MIRSGQQLGVRLSEVDAIIALVRDRRRPCASVRKIISAKRRDVAEQIASLVEFDTIRCYVGAQLGVFDCVQGYSGKVEAWRFFGCAISDCRRQLVDVVATKL